MADVLHSTTNITGGHANAVAGGAAGFLSGADKTKLDTGLADLNPSKMIGWWGCLPAPNNVAARYLDFGNVRDNPNATEESSSMLVPPGVSGTITDMCAGHFNANATSNMTYTLRKNGVDTAGVVTITATNTTATVSGLSIAFTAGDRLSIKAVQSVAVANATMGASIALTYKSS